MRPLFLEYPQDRNQFFVSDRFMFGDSILVTPKFAASDRLKSVPNNPGTNYNQYFDFTLPEGDWFYYVTRQRESNLKI